MYNMAHYDEPLLNELGSMTRSSDNAAQFLSEHIRRSELNIPELDERMVVKHFTHLSQMNYGVDTGIYPLGSCTMKYNFKLLERIAGDNHYTHLHPFQHQSTVQGTLEILFKLQEALCSITGMDAFSLQPMAGAHGEFAGMLIARAYHNSKRVLLKFPQKMGGSILKHLRQFSPDEPLPLCLQILIRWAFSKRISSTFLIWSVK